MVEGCVGEHGCEREERHGAVRLVDPGAEERDAWVVGIKERRVVGE